MEYCRELFGDHIAEFVPVCLHPSKCDEQPAIDELLEIITAEVSQGQAVALVRAYYDQFSTRSARTRRGPSREFGQAFA